MNKLWVYGCSFSEPFGLQSGGAEFDHTGCRIITVPYWGTILADRLRLECRTRSLSGVGWNYITEQIDQDILSWDRNDIIIISPSFFSRVTFEELLKRDSQSLLATQFRSWNQIHQYNETRWCQKVTTLQQLGYQVYTWLVDDPQGTIPANTISAPGDYVNWKLWMDLHPEYWQSLPGVVFPLGDWHFNSLGHQAVAQRMSEALCAPQ